MGDSLAMKKVLLSNVLVAVLAAGAAWFARGSYDELMLDEGMFHVINDTAAERSIELVFPSDERRSAVIAPGRSVDFHVARTGEGAVSVSADGESLVCDSYVTSHNPLTILLVKSDGVLFSQFLRSQAPAR
jgi:hypothetical protein